MKKFSAREDLCLLSSTWHNKALAHRARIPKTRILVKSITLSGKDNFKAFQVSQLARLLGSVSLPRRLLCSCCNLAAQMKEQPTREQMRDSAGKGKRIILHHSQELDSSTAQGAKISLLYRPSTFQAFLTTHRLKSCFTEV